MKTSFKTETIYQLETQVDDMTGQEIAYVMEVVLESGALDVVSVPVLMKKGRPGYLIQVLCRKKDKTKFCEILFEETTTLGVRFSEIKRHILPRQAVTVSTKFGALKAKRSRFKGKAKDRVEFEEIKRIKRSKKK